jgi:hypothetical protein
MLLDLRSLVESAVNVVLGRIRRKRYRPRVVGSGSLELPSLEVDGRAVLSFRGHGYVEVPPLKVRARSVIALPIPDSLRPQVEEEDLLLALGFFD